MNEIQIFQKESFKVRTVMVNDEAWFVAKDVADTLGYSETNRMTEKLDEDEKMSTKLVGISATNPVAIIINESGLYNAILGSKKPEAKLFKKWVINEVLPSIRKNGMYATDVTIEKMLNDPDFAISLLNKLKEEKQKRIEAERTNHILMHVNKTYVMTEIAKELGFKSAIELNNLLAEYGIQYKTNNTWVLCSKYSNRGYEDIKQQVLDNGRVIYHRKITQLGREFILKTIEKIRKEEN